MASASRSAQELRKPFPAWYGEERTSTQQLWCAYHADGQGAWLGRAASFGRLSGVEAGALARRACTECKDGPALRRRPFSMQPTLSQCMEFAPKLSSRRMSAWRARGFDGDAAARAIGQNEDEPEESGSESGDEPQDTQPITNTTRGGRRARHPKTTTLPHRPPGPLKLVSLYCK
jgi:hypothetical protein